MSLGIRAEVAIPDAEVCPLARTTGDSDVTTYSVSKSVDPAVPEHVTEEFAVESSEGGDDADVPEITDENVTKVFETGAQSVYRFERIGHRGCPCECVELHGFPVVSSRAVDGTLSLVFHAPDREGLRDVIGTLEDRYPQVEVRRLLQPRGDSESDTSSLEFFDRGWFTDRQEEVLRTAHRMGYFKRPKGANAGEVAETLDITTATFIQHISAAQQKLLDAILESDPD